MKSFILKRRECSPKEFRDFLKSLGFTYEGWIDEKGQFWPCDVNMMHGFVAGSVLGSEDCDDGEKEADKRRWLRISGYGDRCRCELNQAQLNTLFEYCQFHNVDFQEVLNGIQKL